MWACTPRTARCGIAIYNFDGKVEHGIVLHVGDVVHIREECLGWYRGFSCRNRDVKGIFPVSYVKLKDNAIESELSDGTVIFKEDPLTRELTSVLKEWSIAWKIIYLEGKQDVYDKICDSMCELIDYRKQMIGGNLTLMQIKDLKAKVTAQIDWGNRVLGLDLVPRCEDGTPADADQTGPVELFRLHKANSRVHDNKTIRYSIRPSQLAPCQTRSLNILLSLDLIINNCGHDVLLHISLFDADTVKPISEQYSVQVSRTGKIICRSSASTSAAHSSTNVLFTDVSDKERCGELFLAVFVYRLGSLKEGESSKAPTTVYKRPYGCAVQRIDEICDDQRSTDTEPDIENLYKHFSLKILQCTEAEFCQTVEALIRKQATALNKSSIAPAISVEYSVRLLRGEVERLREEEPLLFRSTVLSNNISCSGIIMPDTLRNDLYLMPVCADLEKGSKSASRNIELRVIVLDKQGNIIPSCIVEGAGMVRTSEYNTAVFYHCNNPHWSETIQLVVPVEMFNTAHVRLELRHCSRKEKTEKKLVGFSFVPLSTDGSTTLSDGMHELFVYKCDDMSKLRQNAGYLVLPHCAGEVLADLPLTHPHYKRSDRESLRINTTLCSTKLTQNGDLLTLLKWRDNPDKIYTSLEKLIKLSGDETVKFLPDIMDTLFNILSVDNTGRSLQHQLVFRALVHVFKLLEDNRYEQFKSVMDSYITTNLSAPLAYRELLICLRDLVSDVTTTTAAPTLQEQFQRCFQVLEYLSKCIVQSRLLCIRKQKLNLACAIVCRAFGASSESMEEFRTLVMSVFSTMYQLISLESDVIIATQVMLIDNLPPVFVHISKLITAEELSDVINQIIHHIPRSCKRPELDRAKLLFLHTLSKSIFFQHPESKKKLLPSFVSQLKRHLVTKTDTRLTCSVLSEVLHNISTDQLQKRVDTQNVECVLDGLLDVLVTSLRSMDKANPLVGEMISCLIAMLRLLDDLLYQKLIDRYSDLQPLKDFLEQMIDLFQILVERNVYPRDWLQMKLTMNSVILQTVPLLSRTICSKFLNGDSFDVLLWQSFFHFCVSFITQSWMRMENFSSAKQQKIKDRYGDMRVQMAYEVLSVWQSLGERRIEFVPGLVGKFLEMTLVPEQELRRVTLPVLFDMMECEQLHHGSFHQVETELVDKLDEMVGNGSGDYDYRLLFNTMDYLSNTLLGRLQKSSVTSCQSSDSMTSLNSISTSSSFTSGTGSSHSSGSSQSSSRPSSAWVQSGVAFVQSVSVLLERLLDYRNLMENEDTREKRMTCTLNLLNFYKNEVNRRAMYVRYIYKLYDLHVASGNHTEAGLTLLLHAELFDWSDRLLEAELNNPIEPEWQRKESLCMKIIKEFDKGKAWEYGLPLCEQLAAVYKQRILYDRLSKILSTQSEFYQKILVQHRSDPEYYRVGFYGQRFPLFLRNKEFIYRGYDCERLTSFQQRLLSEFIGSTILSSNRPPTDQIKHGDNQCIQICSARPLTDADPAFLADSVPDSVRSFYRINNISRFQIDRPYHRGEKNDNNEFETLYLERITLKTVSALPGLLRWSEVESSTTVHLSPIQVAIDTMTSKNSELRSLHFLYTPSRASLPLPDLKPLTMKLNGVIDAAVMGGITKYQEAFFTEQYKVQHPEHAEHLRQLKTLFLEQVQILEAALPVHKKLAPPDLQPLHNRLEKLFIEMKQRIKDPCVVMRHAPPAPTDGRRSLTSEVKSVMGSSTSLSSLDGVSCVSNRSSGVYCEADNQSHHSSDSLSNVESSTLPKSSSKDTAGVGRRSTLTFQSSPLPSSPSVSAPSSATPEGSSRWWSMKSILTSRSRESSVSKRDASPARWYVNSEDDEAFLSKQQQQQEQQQLQRQQQPSQQQSLQQQQQQQQQSQPPVQVQIIPTTPQSQQAQSEGQMVDEGGSVVCSGGGDKPVRPLSAGCNTLQEGDMVKRVTNERKNLSEPHLTYTDTNKSWITSEASNTTTTSDSRPVTMVESVAHNAVTTVSLTSSASSSNTTRTGVAALRQTFLSYSTNSSAQTGGGAQAGGGARRETRGGRGDDVISLQISLNTHPEANSTGHTGLGNDLEPPQLPPKRASSALRSPPPVVPARPKPPPVPARRSESERQDNT